VGRLNRGAREKATALQTRQTLGAPLDEGDPSQTAIEHTASSAHAGLSGRSAFELGKLTLHSQRMR
jgi:hypothetical protein